MDLMVTLINHNLRKNLQSDWYRYALTVLQRILVHLKRFRIRLQYHWSTLYLALISLIRFIVSNTDTTLTRPHLRLILESVRAKVY